ncbi:MAG TPA: nickel-dependent lactate racemase [bacterium]|nr:nickel-dependent lactate racemase [bacterium]
MRVELNYGRGKLGLEVPAGCEVTLIGKRRMPVLPDAAAAMEATLAAPVAAPPLAEAARGARRACILICDITRPVPNGLILPALLRTLLAAGLQAEQIQVLVATGLHRPNEGEELAELVGDPTVLRTVRVSNHDARDDAAHVPVGTTSRGTRVLLDRRFVEADLRIVTGLVEPHFMAGYSGGRKVIAPGVAHRETITTFHSARFMEHPHAANCVLEGNPLHAEQLEIVEMLGGALAVNAVIDEARQVSFLNYGEIVASHLAAVDFIRRYAEVPVPRRFKTVLTSAAGYPLDKTYYQTVKGMVGPLDILAPGGNLIIASECSEGMGSADYVAAQRRLVALGPERFLAEISAKRHADIDEWQTEMQLKPMRVGAIHLYAAGLPPESRALTGVTVVDSLEAALQASVTQTGDPHVAVIPEGPYVVPRYQPDA